MLPDDLFRSQLQTTMTVLKYWAPSIAEAARIDEQETGSFWKLSVTPRLGGSCPFELIFRFDQRFDLAVADETYENLQIETFDLFLPFAEAIAAGDVVQRRWISRLTGIERSVETIVTMPAGRVWREARGELPTVPSLDDDGTELRERRFLPYLR
jgi:hypothetical protein